MSRTFLRQSTQINQSASYDDSLSAGSGLESVASIEGDLNALRSQMKRVIHDDAAGNWYDDVPTINSKKRGVKDLNTDLNDLEAKAILCGVTQLTNVTVPNAQNYVVLSAASSETPSDSAAIGTGLGAVVSVLGAAEIGTHKLTEIAGKNAVSPKNLCTIRDASSKDLILSNGKQVYGLLQAENGVVQDDAFDDADAQIQLSFVRDNGSDDLEAVPVADIEDKVVEFVYPKRVTLDTLPEDCNFPFATFADQTAPVDVTLNAAIDNQSGTATQAQNVDWDIADAKQLAFTSNSGARDMQAFKPTGAGDEVEWNVDDFDVNNVNTADFAQGLSVDSDDQAINLGATTGQIDTSGNLKVKATGASADLTMEAGLELKIVDGNKSGSTFAGDLKLAETAQEWSDYETQFGEVSLLNALKQAKTSAGEVITEYKVSSDISANADFDPGTNATVINGSIQDLSAYTFVGKLKIFLNGQRLVPGADASANNDYYPGTDLVNSELKFEFDLKQNDIVTIEAAA